MSRAFIKLTSTTGPPIWVRAADITSVFGFGNHTALGTASDTSPEDYIKVTETPEQILEMIAGSGDDDRRIGRITAIVNRYHNGVATGGPDDAIDAIADVLGEPF